MAQTREAMTQHLAERRCWRVARRDDARVARRLYRTPVVDGGSQLDEGAWVEACCSGLHERGVVDWLRDVQGTAVQRERGPVVHDVLRDRLKTRWGLERLHALPTRLVSDEALMRLVGVKASRGRPGGGPRGAARRQGPRRTGPIGAEALAEPLVALHRRDLEAWCTGVIRGLAQAGVLAAKVPGRVDGTALETTAPAAGGGQVTRQRQSTDTRGHGHPIEVTVYGGKLGVLIEARTTSPWAAPVVPIQAHEPLARRALGTPARPTLAGYAPRHNGGFDRGVGDGVERGGLQPHGLRLVVPATRPRAVPREAHAHAAAGEGRTRGRRVPTVRPGQGNTAWRARLETAGVGIAARPTADQDGPPEQGGHHPRRHFQPTPINAVVVRTGPGRAVGPGGNPVLRTKAPGETP